MTDPINNGNRNNIVTNIHAAEALAKISHLENCRRLWHNAIEEATKNKQGDPAFAAKMNTLRGLIDTLTDLDKSRTRKSTPQITQQIEALDGEARRLLLSIGISPEALM